MNVAKPGLFFLFFVGFSNAILFIDRHTADYNARLSNWTVTYFSDAKGNSVVNTTIEIFVTLTKMLTYIKVKVSENPFDKEYRRELVRTVIDVAKFMENTQSNPLVREFVNSITKRGQIKIAYPMPPVTHFDQKQRSKLEVFSTGNIQNGEHFLRISISAFQR